MGLWGVPQCGVSRLVLADMPAPSLAKAEVSATVVDLLVSSHSSICFCLMYFNALLLEACVFRTAMY